MTRLILRPLSRLVVLLALVVAFCGPGAAQDDPAPAASSALSDLLATLKDEAARDALIAELEAATAAPDDVATETVVETAPSFGAQVAAFTQSVVDQVTGGVTSVVSSLRGGQRLLRGLDGETWGTILDATIDLALVIVVTVAVFFTLRRMAIPILRRIGQNTKGRDLVRKGAGLAGSVLIRIAVVVLAWAIAYSVTILVVGDFGQIGLRQSLFLNAFLVVELIKVGVRTVFSPAADDLRGLPMSDWAAGRISMIASTAISILGYGVLLVVPIISDAATFLATRAVSVLVVEIALVYLATMVLWHRTRVADWLVDHILAPADPDAPPPREGVFHAALTHWHWLALGYLALLGIQMLTRSLEAMGQNVLAVIEIAGVAFLGALVFRFLAQSARAGVRLPEYLTIRLPLLEGRLNRVVPRVLLLLRLLVGAFVLIYALDRAGLTDIWGWVRGENGAGVVGTIVSVAAILTVAYLMWLAVSSWIDFRLNPDYGGAPSNRETTLLSLLKNAVSVALLILAVMFALSELGLNIGPLIASAGVLGLAIGFGAQKLVQDIITGVFIQFENAINVGDVITVGGITGGVEKLTIRSVSLRDLHGVFHIVPFSSVDMVSNFTREFSYYVIDMGVAYREAVDDVRKAMEDAYDLLREDAEQGIFLLGDLEYFGLNSFGDSAIVVRARIKTWPGKQWGVGRAYNRLLKAIMDERGIEIPFPHTTITFAEAKDGTRQALPIEQLPGTGG
ncbi:MAG: mechanosensitive ion channel domain-containing protein [Pseudomonadota bacterium]